ncbi:hypothetical protein MTR67_019684 [Solanum verrucosum]|uniref:Uncharacterized protein n=1 Tax=Solanum verrucosum TaxID=315347 RepID=A0AAF0QUQ3_SOLVR|nr:hypothetical protein MTR67_019684 [Solanum verrucosum]
MVTSFVNLLFPISSRIHIPIEFNKNQNLVVPVSYLSEPIFQDLVVKLNKYMLIFNICSICTKRSFYAANIVLEPASFISTLVAQAEEDTGFDHQIAGVKIPFKEDAFFDLTSRLGRN